MGFSSMWFALILGSATQIPGQYPLRTTPPRYSRYCVTRGRWRGNPWGTRWPADTNNDMSFRAACNERAARPHDVGVLGLVGQKEPASKKRKKKRPILWRTAH